MTRSDGRTSIRSPAGPVDPALARVGLLALVVGGSVYVVLVVTGFFTPRHFFPAYLMAFLLWFGVSAGCLALVMLHNLVGGRWGRAIRPLLETGARGVFLMALLFVPLLFGLRVNYPWARPEEVRGDEVMMHQARWMNPTRFTLFGIGYFVVLGGLTAILTRPAPPEAPRDVTILGTATDRRAKAISGPGMLVYGIVVSLAAIDWAMSLEPRWYSTIFGLLFIVGQALSALATMTIALWFVSTRLGETSGERVVPSDFHDLGNLMLTFTILWAYMSFAQFLIIWAGNLPAEAVYYVPRMRDGWQFVGLGLVVLHWGLPFAVLLSREIKRRGGRLAALAVFILIMRQVDLFWVVFPSAGKRNGAAPTLGHSATNFADYLAPIAIGGLWIAFFAWQLAARQRRGESLLPEPPTDAHEQARSPEQAGHLTALASAAGGHHG